MRSEPVGGPPRPICSASADGAVADVAAELHAVEADGVDRLVGALLRRLDVVAERGDAEHAAAGGDDLAVLRGRAGVEDVHVVAGCRASGRPWMTSPLLGVSGIVGGGQHDAERDAAVPFGFDLVEAAVDGGFEQGDEVALQAHHDRLGFRVAHAAVEFQHLERAVRLDHQAGVEEAGVGNAVLLHAVDGRHDDFAHRLGVDFRRHHRRRRVGAHAAGVRALVAVLQALVVLAGGQRPARSCRRP